MKYKEGQTLYEYISSDTKGTVEIQEWRVRSIRKGRVTAIAVTSFTWVKLSKKHGHFGWAKSIPQWCRETFSPADTSLRLQTTKRAAAVAELKAVKRGVVTDDEEVKAKLVRTLTSLVSRRTKKKAKCPSWRCPNWPICSCLIRGEKPADCPTT